MPSAAAKSDDDWNEEEDYFMEKPSIRFEDVGGMKRIKEEISIKIIHHCKTLICIKLLVKRSEGAFYCMDLLVAVNFYCKSNSRGDQC
jgi:hypothetical protein